MKQTILLGENTFISDTVPLTQLYSCYCHGSCLHVCMSVGACSLSGHASAWYSLS